jgi:hypothetical protein
MPLIDFVYFVHFVVKNVFNACLAQPKTQTPARASTCVAIACTMLSASPTAQPSSNHACG